MMHVPLATYRLQFNPTFDFESASRVVDYLRDLGISDIYASPIFTARKGSRHGYDLVDPTTVNPELGGLAGYERLVGQIRSHNMGWLQDIVPNHMAFASDNQMLMDVLENGEHSRFFRFFDIRWDHPYESIRGRVLAPFLGRFYGECLEDGEIQLKYGEHGFAVHYDDIILPVRIESYFGLLTQGLDNLRMRLGEDHPDLVSFQVVLNVLRMLPTQEDPNGWSDQVRFAKTMLWQLYTRNDQIQRFMDHNVAVINGSIGNSRSFDPLNEILGEQRFRLSFWKVATEEINYRRFFNINELICLKMEEQEVFHATHALILRLVREHNIAGLRIDHVDGLYDPAAYLRWLREAVDDIYIVVEKILDFEEQIPTRWPVQGTTGYDFMNHVNGLFCKRENERHFDRIFKGFTTFGTPYEELRSDKKRLIMGKHMAGDVDNLAHLMKGVSSRDRHGSDITIYGLKRALVEVMAQFPVYRTYISQDNAEESERAYIRCALEKAKTSSPGLLNEFDFLERFFLTPPDATRSDEERQRIECIMRFQQMTGPLMAKGFEDTTLYVYNRLLSLNEVGGDPGRFGLSAEGFHRFNQTRGKHWPHAINATSTHDTKRGEDARARINVLSEIPAEWQRAIRTWSRLNAKKRTKIRGQTIPDRNDEYFLYQTLIGTFPFDGGVDPEFVERIKTYVIKAVREAKVHTAWLKPDTTYENAYLAFVEAILNRSDENRFLNEFLPFQQRMAHYGVYNSLAQTLIKITGPGVPDFYQGTELWDLSLVDPDNRRPVDFQKRRQALTEIRERLKGDRLSLVRELLRTTKDGRIKLFLIHQVLHVRKEYGRLFQNGAYVPLQAQGRFSRHIVAFARTHEGQWVITIVPRFLTTLIQEGEELRGRSLWSDTHLPLTATGCRLWRNILTNQRLRCADSIFVGDALEHFPVALLISEERP
jgi:(1->4)-alpha-D-glucan 1-alpha-D-glucosylmutase